MDILVFGSSTFLYNEQSKFEKKLKLFVHYSDVMPKHLKNFIIT